MARFNRPSFLSLLGLLLGLIVQSNAAPAPIVNGLEARGALDVDSESHRHHPRPPTDHQHSHPPYPPTLKVREDDSEGSGLNEDGPKPKLDVPMADEHHHRHHHHPHPPSLAARSEDEEVFTNYPPPPPHWPPPSPPQWPPHGPPPHQWPPHGPHPPSARSLDTIDDDEEASTNYPQTDSHLKWPPSPPPGIGYPPETKSALSEDGASSDTQEINARVRLSSV
ncbi:hypothetical protein DTO166G5_4216 [Paecilomyces variotii]|nr:hypothetical protein DTO166G5_4216 [Paecilomyces variotii]